MKSIITILLTLLALQLHSQKMELIQFKKTNNTEARINKVYSINKDKCALIKINTPLNNLLFDTPEGICKVEQHTGDWWVYVTPHTRRLEIRHKQFKVLQYNIPTTIQEMTTYQAELSTDQTVTTIITAKKPTYLAIKTQPQGAEVYINNKTTGKRTPFQQLITTGTYAIQLKLHRYKTYSQSININSTKTKRLNINLQPLFKPLTINTNPTGANIYLDNKLIGTTPHTIQELDYGQHQFTLSKNLHKTKTINLTISTTSRDITHTLTPLYGTLRLNTDKTYSVQIDGTKYTQHTIKLNPGKHFLEILSPFIHTYSQYITITEKKELVITPTIRHRIRTLQFTATPMEVDVYQNNKKIGTTPFVKELPYNHYTFTANKNGQTITTSYDMSKTSQAQIHFNFNKNTCQNTIDLTQKSIDYTKLFKLCTTQVHKTKDPTTQYNLAKLYQYGKGTSKNLQQAIKWYTLSAKTNSKAHIALAQIYQHGISKDLQQAIKHLQQAIKQRDTQAYTLLGSIYRYNTTLDKHMAQAIKWYTLSASQGNRDAMLYLGQIHEKELGKHNNLKIAVQWYTRAAKQGQHLAQYNLGYLYETGKGVPTSLRNAIKWYTLSAQAGYMQASYRMGYLYEYKIPTPNHLRIALQWYTQATSQGSIQAQQKTIALQKNI